ncbi:unnamed protein product [Timema podura]|uniref:Uncharacterized protein n=1 Tax=Timema podura TaxID=61482 RepID=A0ABN7P967_TIMPD|nr:unnamed protein product [Timema podura]
MARHKYQLLVEESRAAHINDDPQVQTVLQQLLQSNTTNLSGIHKPQEKLCMLVMSLHPQELCTLHWQAALKFVFEEILEGAEGTVEISSGSSLENRDWQQQQNRIADTLNSTCESEDYIRQETRRRSLSRFISLTHLCH